MSFIKELQKKINKVTEGYFANWTPDMPVSVGDYGDISGYRFTRDGNINRILGELDIDSVRSETATFERNDGLAINTSATGKGDATLAKTSLSLKFGAEGAFLYHLSDITNVQFRERREVFEMLGPLILSGKIIWKDDYVLVTEVKAAGKAIIYIADSANAELELECSSHETAIANLATAMASIEIKRDSDRILRYEIDQITPLLFRVIGFSEVPPDGGPSGPMSSMMQKVRSWFGNENLPAPESIYLRDYLDEENTIEGTFVLPNGEPIRLCQKVESIGGFIEKSESNIPMEQEAVEKVVLQKVRLRQRNG